MELILIGLVYIAVGYLVADQKGLGWGDALFWPLIVLSEFLRKDDEERWEE